MKHLPGRQLHPTLPVLVGSYYSLPARPVITQRIREVGHASLRFGQAGMCLPSYPDA